MSLTILSRVPVALYTSRGGDKTIIRKITTGCIMNILRLLVLTPVLAGIAGAALGADSESPVPELQRLVNAQQYQEAVVAATPYRAEWEGDTQFDFYYGLASLEVGGSSANEAVFTLERAAATAGNGVLRERARLELARAYFVTNNLTAAENLFNVVLENNPPANVRQNIEAFLQLIETRQNSQEPTFNWTIASVLGSDDNINSATSNGLIDTPLVGQIELNPDGQQTEDSFSNTTLTMAYVYPFTRDRSLSANVSFVHLDNFDTDQFDIDNLRGSLTYGWGNDINRFRHGAALTTVQLDGIGFQDSVALNSSWQRSYGNGWYHNLSGAYSQIRYDDTATTRNSLRDVDQVLFTGGMTKVAGPFTHSLNLYTADESPENSTGGSHNGREFSGLAYSVLYRLNAQNTPFLRASTQDVEHDSTHPVFFNTVRQDDTDSVTLGWFWQLRRNLMITAETAYTNNTSNIPLFDYTRFKYQAGFRYQF